MAEHFKLVPRVSSSPLSHLSLAPLIHRNQSHSPWKPLLASTFTPDLTQQPWGVRMCVIVGYGGVFMCMGSLLMNVLKE